VAELGPEGVELLVLLNQLGTVGLLKFGPLLSEVLDILLGLPKSGFSLLQLFFKVRVLGLGLVKGGLVQLAQFGLCGHLLPKHLFLFD